MYTGHGWYDPNFRTLDNERFNFQGLGDYVIVEALDVTEDDTVIAFAFQGRFTQHASNPGVTWHTLLAFGEPDLVTFQVCYSLTNIT